MNIIFDFDVIFRIISRIRVVWTRYTFHAMDVFVIRRELIYWLCYCIVLTAYINSFSKRLPFLDTTSLTPLP